MTSDESISFVQNFKPLKINDIKTYRYYQICSLCNKSGSHMVKELLIDENFNILKITYASIPENRYWDFINKVPPQQIEVVANYCFDNVQYPNYQKLAILMSPLLN